MTTGEALYAILSADAAVAALVATRITPDELPEASPLPAIVYTVVDDVPENTFAPASVINCRIQIDCYARPTRGAGGAYKAAQAVADAVDAALAAQQGSSFSSLRLGSRNLFDNETQYRRVSMDFSVWR